MVPDSRNSRGVPCDERNHSSQRARRFPQSQLPEPNDVPGVVHSSLQAAIPSSIRTVDEDASWILQWGASSEGLAMTAALL